MAILLAGIVVVLAKWVEVILDGHGIILPIFFLFYPYIFVIE